MNRIMKASVSDVVLKSTPNSVEKPSLTYRSLAENTKTFKSFRKEFKLVEGKPMGDANSWKAFAEKHPIIWDEIKEVIESRILNGNKAIANQYTNAKNGNKKQSLTTKQVLDEVKEDSVGEKDKFFVLTFHKPDKFLWVFPTKGCKFSHVTKEKDLSVMLDRTLKQGYTLIKIEEYVETSDVNMGQVRMVEA